MIVACIRKSKSRAEWFFRGYPVSFWIKKIWPFFFIPAGQAIPEDNSGLIVFRDDLFLFPTADFLAEIKSIIEKRNSFAESPWTIAGTPFIVYSGALIKKAKPLFPVDAIEECPADLPVVATENEYRLFSPATDPVGASAALLSCQVRMLSELGVVIEDPLNFYLEGDIAVGPGTRIGSGAVIGGKSLIGGNVEIASHVCLQNVTVGDNCRILPGCVLHDSVLAENVTIGPYAHLREGCRVASLARIGNFVEMKNTSFGPGSKALHLSYLGDAQVGRDVNIGAGTITCNFDGQRKHPTRIEDSVFIGSGSELVAPLTIEKESYVGAGSTITQDVPAGALAIARERQRNINGWVKRKRPLDAAGKKKTR